MIRIEKFKIEDFHSLTEWIKTEEELVQFAGPIFKFPLVKEQIEVYLKDENRTVFKVINIEDESKIGIAELFNSSKEANKIARVLIGDRTIRGKGIGTKLIQKLVEHSFRKDLKKYVSLNVYDWNIAAIKCYERVGFNIADKKAKITKIGNKTWKSIEMKIENNLQ